MEHACGAEDDEDRVGGKLDAGEPYDVGGVDRRPGGVLEAAEDAQPLAGPADGARPPAVLVRVVLEVVIEKADELGVLGLGEAGPCPGDEVGRHGEEHALAMGHRVAPERPWRRGSGASSSSPGHLAHVGEGELLAIAGGELPRPVTSTAAGGIEIAETAGASWPDRDPPAAADTGAEAMVLAPSPASFAAPAVGARRSPGEAVDAGAHADRRVLVAADAQAGAVVVGGRLAAPARRRADRATRHAGVAVVGPRHPHRSLPAVPAQPSAHRRANDRWEVEQRQLACPATSWDRPRRPGGRGRSAPPARRGALRGPGHAGGRAGTSPSRRR